MAVLAKCWLIVECFLIPDGSMNWFFLSIYIHPFFLCCCQIFLWIKTFKRWIFSIIFFLNRYIFSHIHVFLRRFLIKRHLSSSSGSSDSNTEAEDKDVWYEATDHMFSTSEILFLHYEISCEIPKIVLWDTYVESVDQETLSVCSSSDLDDEITSFSAASSPISVSSYSFSSRRDEDVISRTPSSCTLLEDQETANNVEVRKGLTDFLTPVLVVKPHEKEKDSFYKSYIERMRWFDLLNQERTCELNAFLTKKQDMGVEKRILKSLESDLEMVYVAQLCLSWEALNDQYRKLESIIASSSSCGYTSPYGALCSSSLVNKFQRFQILLERFLEDERSEKGKRYWNFIHKSSNLKSLLQVPEISENADVYEEGRNEELMIRATDVLKTIEKCMKTFKLFIEADEKKPWWRTSKRLSTSRSPLEDPRDLHLLHKLAHILRQKELWMKDMKGKKSCWFRKRVKIMEDVQKKQMMFTTIELKLVSRVLMMSVISNSQLQWCQQKLDNIEIGHGRITRLCTGSVLFPPS